MTPVRPAGTLLAPALLLISLAFVPLSAAAQDQYLVGDWDGDGKDNIAVRIGSRILMDTNSDGVPDQELVYGNGASETEYLVGDWDGDGKDNIAVRRNNRVLMDTNFDGSPDIEQTFGSDENEPDQYLVGDWDGDGKDNLATRKGTRFFKDTNFDDKHDLTESFGRGRNLSYLVGDFEGKGRDILAYRRGRTIFKASGGGGESEKDLVFGNGDAEDQYLVGDWDGDGRDNLAVRRGATILMDTNFDTEPDFEFTFTMTLAPAVSVTSPAQPVIIDGTAILTEVVTPPDETPPSTEPAPTPPPAETEAPQSPQIDGTLTIATAESYPEQYMRSDLNREWQHRTDAGQLPLLPQGRNYAGSQVSENRQEQVLLRLYGMPYGTYPMLEAAARRRLTHKTGSATPEAVAAYLQSLYDNPDLRIGLAAPLLVEGVEAILADDRTEEQQTFYSTFSRYSAAIEYAGTISLYNSWRYFTGEGTDFAKPIEEYENVTLGVLISEGSKGKKFSDFEPPVSGLGVGPAGLLAAADLFGSGIANDIQEPPLDPEVDVPALEELALLLGNVGGPAAFVLLGKAFNNNFQSVVLGKAATQAASQARLAAKRMGEVDRLAYQTAKDAAEQQGKAIEPFEQWIKQNDARIANKIAKKAGGEVAEEAAEEVSKKILKEVSEEIVEKAVVKGTSQASQRAGQKLAARLSLNIINTLGKTGATVLGGCLLAIPALVDVVMIIVDIAETAEAERFDAEIKATYEAGPASGKDLKAMIAPNREYDAGLCYQWCKPGYTGLATLCYKECPEGYENDPITCRRDPEAISKERYHRGQIPMQCAPGQVEDAGLCYKPCAEGYTGLANSCNYTSCPDGFRDDGLYCAKPAPYGRGAGYALWDKPICERDNQQGCEQSGLIIYPKCQENYHATGCCVCSPDCPQGWDDIGVSCKKPSYDRGVGVAVSSCAAGYERIGALCYPTCQAGFTGELDYCTKHECPADYRSDPLTCFRDAHIFGRESYDRGVGFVAMSEESCLSDEKRLTNISAIIGHMTKMMVSDAADAGISILPGDRITPTAPQMMGFSSYY